MKETKPSLIDSLKSLRKRYMMSCEEVMSFWHQYSYSALKYHSTCPDEFHILVVRYVNNSVLTSFEDFVSMTLREEGRLKVDETLF